MNEGLKKIWKNNKTFIIVVSIIVPLTIFHAVRVERISKDKDQEFYKTFNESFAGKVVKIIRYDMFSDKIQISAGPKFEAYYLNLQKSTIKNYDQRDSTPYTYCIIKDSMAIVIEEVFPEKHIETGDILYYNGKVDSMYHYKIFLKDTYFKIENRKYIAKRNKPILVGSWKPIHLLNGNRRLFVKSLNNF